MPLNQSMSETYEYIYNSIDNQNALNCLKIVLSILLFLLSLLCPKTQTQESIKVEADMIQEIEI